MVEYINGMKIFDIDMDNLQLGIKGMGVYEGCSVSAAGGSTIVSWSGGRYRSANHIFSSLSSGSLTLSGYQDATNPRKAIIYLDDTDQTVKAALGDAEAAYPGDLTGRYTSRPIPPDLSGDYTLSYDDVTMAEIWLKPTGQTVASTDISDRRVIIPASFEWDDISPMDSPGSQSLGSEWFYTVSSGKRGLLTALHIWWEVSTASQSRYAYVDVKTSDSYTIMRWPPSGNWATQSTLWHFSYDINVGATVSDYANLTDRCRPMPQNFELPEGAVIAMHCNSTIHSGDYLNIDWVYREVDQ